METYDLFNSDPWDFDFTITKSPPQLYCKGGGGGSGKVEYPTYMQDQHTAWLSDMDTLVSSTTSPFFAEVAYDPTADIGVMVTAVATMASVIAALNHTADWESAVETAKAKVATVIDDTYLDNDIAAYANILDTDIQDNTLPVFQSGMRDVNAVQTSAFVMGEAKIWADKAEQINKYATGLRLQNSLERNKYIFASAQSILQQLQMTVEMEKVLMQMTLETYRIKIIAFKEQAADNLEIDEKDARWEFDKYMYAGDLLASIGGGTSGSGYRPSKAQSALGGAMSGAAAGAMVGGPVGAGVGGALGLLSGLL